MQAVLSGKVQSRPSEQRYPGQDRCSAGICTEDMAPQLQPCNGFGRMGCVLHCVSGIDTGYGAVVHIVSFGWRQKNRFLCRNRYAVDCRDVAYFLSMAEK